MKCIAAFLLLCSVQCFCQPAVADWPFRTVALSRSRQPAPHESLTIRFLALDHTPTINDSGQVAFSSLIFGNGVDSDSNKTIWSEGSGSLSLVARTGQQAVGMSTGTTYQTFESPILNNLGQTAFRVALPGTTQFSTEPAIYSDAGGVLDLVIRSRVRAFGTPAADRFDGFSDPSLDENGRAVFLGFLQRADSTQFRYRGIWRGTDDDFELIALNDGGTLTDRGTRYFTSFDLPTINRTGQIAIRGSSTTENGSTKDGGIFVHRDGELFTVAMEGEIAPGTSGFKLFDDVGRPRINDNGQVAFLGRLQVRGFPAGEGIWLGDENTLEPVYQSGVPVPGLEGDARFSTFSDPLIDAAGNTAFVATIVGDDVSTGTSRVLWNEAGPLFGLVAREGDQAPGTPNGATFRNFTTRMELNNAGQLAFVGTLVGEGIETGNANGIWAQDLSGTLHLIVRQGDMMDVNDDPLIDDFRTVSGFSIAWDPLSNKDGHRSGFNDRGQLAFQASFTDGSTGIFVSNLVAIPEPSAAILLATSCIGTLLRRRRNQPL